MKKRIFADLILLLGALILPWWLVLLLLVCAALRFDHYIEMVGIALVMDFISGVPRPLFLHIQFVMAVSALLLFIIVHFAKERLIVYRSL